MSNKSVFEKGLDKVYSKVGYFDKYGGSFIITLITLLSFTVVFCYFWAQSQIVPIKADWDNMKYHPAVIPVAGWINAPPGVSKFKFTADNFSAALFNILGIITKKFTSPIYFLTGALTRFFTNILAMVNSIRKIIDYIRVKIMSMIMEIMQRFINVVTPIHLMVLKLKSLLGKVQGTMVTGLYTAIGSYFALKAFIHAFLKLIVLALIVLVGVVIVLWIFPWTWSLALIGTTAYVALAIPSIIIAVWMGYILNIGIGDTVPELCFDENTLIELREGKVNIKNIKVGSILRNGSIVTTKFKLKKGGETMYNLDNIFVSGSHMVNYKGKWIYIDEHPDAKIIEKYNKSFLYCINTSNKKIKIGKHLFLDWDDITEQDMIKLKNKLYLDLKDNEKTIHKKLESGFVSNTIIEMENGNYKNIQNLQIDDIIKGGHIVYGLVETDDKEVFKYKINGKIFYGNNLVNNEQFNNINYLNKCEKLYNIVTNSGFININDTTFLDYNGILEQKLDVFEDKPKKC